MASEFYKTEQDSIVQITKQGECSLVKALNDRRIVFDELTARKLLKMLLTLLHYFSFTLQKNFDFSVFDIILVKNIKKNNKDKFCFKLKNCVLEEPSIINNTSKRFSLNAKPLSFVNRCNPKDFCSSLEKIGRLVLFMARNPYGFKHIQSNLSSGMFSESLLYVVNVLIRYRLLVDPPGVEELLGFFQDSRELYTERVKKSLYNNNRRNNRKGKEGFPNKRNKSSFL